MTNFIPCQTCNGSGCNPFGDAGVCPDCIGSGEQSPFIAHWEREDWEIDEIMNGGAGMHDVASSDQQNAEWRSIWRDRMVEAMNSNDRAAAIRARDMWRQYK